MPPCFKRPTSIYRGLLWAYESYHNRYGFWAYLYGKYEVVAFSARNAVQVSDVSKKEWLAAINEARDNGFESADGIPWEIHGIGDPYAYVAALTAWREER